MVQCNTLYLTEENWTVLFHFIYKRVHNFDRITNAQTMKLICYNSQPIPPSKTIICPKMIERTEKETKIRRKKKEKKNNSEWEDEMRGIHPTSSTETKTAHAPSSALSNIFSYMSIWSSIGWELLQRHPINRHIPTRQSRNYNRWPRVLSHNIELSY